MAIMIDRHYFLLKNAKTEHLYFNYQQKYEYLYVKNINNNC